MSKNYTTVILAVATNIFYIVLERMGTSGYYTIALAAVSAILYSWAIWHWSGRFRYYPISKNRNRHAYIHERSLQMALTGLFLSLFVGVIAYQQIRLQPPSNEMVSTLERYRRMLGLIKGSGATTLIELTNSELKQKGTLLYKKIREINSFHDKRLQQLNDSNAIDEELRRVEEEYDSEVKVDAIMVLEELRSRIPYERRNHLMGLPEINPADPKSGSPTMYRAPWSGPFNVMFSQMIANEMEELVKLLPDK